MRTECYRASLQDQTSLLLDPETHTEYLSYTTARLIVIPIGTLIAIGVAFWNVWVAEGIFLFFYGLGWFLRGLFYFWLLVLVLEVADLIYRRVLRTSRREVHVEADV